MDSQQTQQNKEKQETPVSKPNERAGFAVMGHLKIFDPNTKEVKVETRE